MEDKTPTQILANTKDLASKEKAEKKMFQVKGSVNGAITGLVAGLMIGYYKDYNLVISGFAGIMLGGIISHYVLRDNEKIIKNK